MSPSAPAQARGSRHALSLCSTLHLKNIREACGKKLQGGDQLLVSENLNLLNFHTYVSVIHCLFCLCFVIWGIESSTFLQGLYL